MIAFFKPSVFTSVILTSALAISACSKTPQTQAELIVGDWKQAAPITMTEGGTTITMTESYANYDADGTSNGGLKMSLSGAPVELADYKMETEGTWRIEDGMLIETITDLDVSSSANSPQGNAIAAQMESAMGATGESRSEIKSLTKDALVVYQAETGTTISFKR